MSEVSKSVQKHVTEKLVNLLYPSRETLAAIKRLEAGKGIVVTFHEFVEGVRKAYPEYSSMIDEYLEGLKEISKSSS
jgi:hypothetical protein